MTDWDLTRSATRADFIDQMEGRGFVATSDGVRDVMNGRLCVGDSQESVRIEIEQGFPFYPPRVFPEESVPRSWHRELDGAMCLYSEDDRDGLPWLDVDDFLRLLIRWLEQTATGWPNDSLDFDLERYFLPAAEPRLVVFGDLDPFVGNHVRMLARPHTIEVLGRGGVPKKQTHKNRPFGYVLDIGEPATPPSTWEHIAELIPIELARYLERVIRERRISMLLLRYARHGRTAALALRATPSRHGIVLRSHPSASNQPETLMLRAGHDLAILTSRRVCVVGAGAVGSHTCDLLARAGVGHLTIRDGDILRPGNLVRHLGRADQIGLNKAKAVRDILRQGQYGCRDVTAIPHPLTDPNEVPALFADFELVVDATADASVTEMLSVAARALNHRFLSACLQDEGDVVRVDVIPPLIGAPLPEVSRSVGSVRRELVYEGGCASPVSRTPPHAVTQAAALTARHAVGLLTGSPVHPAGEAQIYTATLDA